jgi:hypothetical protein
LPRNPGGYFRVGCGADSRGNLVVAVRNEAPVPVTGLVLAVDIVDNAGRTRRLTQELRGVLQSGEVAQANMGIGPWTGGSCPAGVIAARPVS